MNYIFKYQLSEEVTQEIEMPEGAEILSMQVQHGVTCIWAKVDKEKQAVRRRFIIVGTGWEVPAAATKFIGTFQLNGGAYVFHLFEDDGGEI